MSRTVANPDDIFTKIAKPSANQKQSAKAKAKPTEEATIDEKPTAKLSISITPSMKQKLDDMVYERKKTGEKTSASDIVRQLLEPILGE